MRVCMSPRRLCSTFTWRGISVYLEIPVFVHFSFGSHVCKKKVITIKIGTQFVYHYEEDNLEFIAILILLCKILICLSLYSFFLLLCNFDVCSTYLREIISSEVAQICLSAMGLLVFKLQFSAFPDGLIFWFISFAAIYWSLLHSMMAT